MPTIDLMNEPEGPVMSDDEIREKSRIIKNTLEQFGLEVVNCVGCCGQSPVVTVDDDIYGYMRQSRVVELLGNYNHSGE